MGFPRTLTTGPALRLSYAAQIAGLRGRSDCDACAWDRRKHGAILSRERCLAKAFAVSASRTTRLARGKQAQLCQRFDLLAEFPRLGEGKPHFFGNGYLSRLQFQSHRFG